MQYEGGGSRCSLKWRRRWWLGQQRAPGRGPEPLTSTGGIGPGKGASGPPLLRISRIRPGVSWRGLRLGERCEESFGFVSRSRDERGMSREGFVLQSNLSLSLFSQKTNKHKTKKNFSSSFQMSSCIPPPPGSPGEGPDGHFRSGLGINNLGPVSARSRGVMYF